MAKYGNALNTLAPTATQGINMKSDIQSIQLMNYMREKVSYQVHCTVSHSHSSQKE